jgi:hypothetical protein
MSYRVKLTLFLLAFKKPRQVSNSEQKCSFAGETPGYRGIVPGIFFVFCLSGPTGARLLLSCSLPIARRLCSSGSDFDAAKQANRTVRPVTISPKKRLFSSIGTEGAFYEGYLGHTNGGSSRYVVFDYVAYGGAQLGTQQRAGRQQPRKSFRSRSAFDLEEPLILSPSGHFEEQRSQQVSRGTQKTAQMAPFTLIDAIES